MNPIPQILPPLDPAFVPAVLANRAYRQRVAACARPVRLGIALEREAGLVARHDLDLLPDPAAAAETRRFVERHLKFLLWAEGGWRLTLHGPPELCAWLRGLYAPAGERVFDAAIMQRVYDRPFTVVVAESVGELPAPRAASQPLGGHLDGCRLGFDLGASDYKLAAVRDGEAVFSTEIPWDPVPQTDPAYHYGKLQEGLRLAAGYLPRVDAIGGSSAGIWIANEVKVASLFRGVPAARFEREVKGMFTRLGQEWGVPLAVVNDGDVTALAGGLSLGRRNLLGIAMGSSEAAGWIDPAGRITGFLNELAFAPVDFNPAAPPDEWSGDRGVGALYFSQQAVNKLAPAAGFQFAPEVKLPERLKAVQARADAGDPRALDLFASIGVYLGYALAHYHDYYRFANVLLLGRVSSGAGGERILQTAQQTLAAEFPELAAQLGLFVPDERSRRVGQAVAAASLPEIVR